MEKKYFSYTTRVSSSLYLDQVRAGVGPDLRPNVWNDDQHTTLVGKELKDKNRSKNISANMT